MLKPKVSEPKAQILILMKNENIIWNYLQEGAGRNRVLELSDMLQYKMNFPSEAEQKKIVDVF